MDDRLAQQIESLQAKTGCSTNETCDEQKQRLLQMASFMGEIEVLLKDKETDKEAAAEEAGKRESAANEPPDPQPSMQAAFRTAESASTESDAGKILDCFLEKCCKGHLGIDKKGNKTLQVSYRPQ